jgi:hypothetical protein
MKNVLQLLVSIVFLMPIMVIAQTESDWDNPDRQIANYPTGAKQDEVNLPTVKNAIAIEKSIGKTVKLVGTYIGAPSILSHKESSSGRTFLVLEAKIVTTDNIKVSLSSNEMMLKQRMRSIDEIEKYHDREVVVIGEIAKQGDYLSIVPKNIERLRSW